MAVKQIEQLDKIMGQLQHMDPKTWYYIFAAILVIIFLLDYMILMKPQLTTLTKLNPEIRLLTDNLNKTKTDIERTTQYKNQIQQLKEDVDQLRLRVRTKQEVAFIIEKISRIANKYDVKIDQIMPNPLEQEVLLKNNDLTYSDLPIIIEARSTYHDFGRFINELESEDTFFKLDGFTMAAMTGSRLHAVKVTLKTIVYEENN